MDNYRVHSTAQGDIIPTFDLSQGFPGWHYIHTIDSREKYV